MSTFDEILADETLGRLFGKQGDQARAAVEPPCPPRSGLHITATTAYSWYLSHRPQFGQSCVDKLDADTALTALRAAADLSIALGQRLNQLRAAALPSRLNQPCEYCGKDDCTDRFDHDRWHSANEQTWRQRRRDTKGFPS